MNIKNIPSSREKPSKKIDQKTSINSYTSPTQESPGSSSELYLADRRGPRGAAKSWKAPFSSRLGRRSIGGRSIRGLLLKIHFLSSQVPSAWSSSQEQQRSSSAHGRFLIGVHMQQSLIDVKFLCASGCMNDSHRKKYWFFMVACLHRGGDWAHLHMSKTYPFVTGLMPETKYFMIEQQKQG